MDEYFKIVMADLQEEKYYRCWLIFWRKFHWNVDDMKMMREERDELLGIVYYVRECLHVNRFDSLIDAGEYLNDKKDYEI